MASMPVPQHGDQPSFAPGIRLTLSLKGQLVQSYSFDKDAVVIGRDPYCDVFVDNPGVSRQHFKIRRGETGEYQVMDTGSSNGTYLNDRPIKVATLRDGDVIQFGKYSLKVNLDELVGSSESSIRPRSAADGATVMLSPSEVRQMVADARTPGAAARKPPAVRSAQAIDPEHSPVPDQPAASNSMTPAMLVAAIGAGVVVAALVAWYILSR
jgi:pSer/pThr/pTyr-binding forkhead associated (FHA) protein